MGHSRQTGGFAEAPQARLEGYPLLPEAARGEPRKLADAGLSSAPHVQEIRE